MYCFDCIFDQINAAVYTSYEKMNICIKKTAQPLCSKSLKV